MKKTSLFLLMILLSGCSIFEDPLPLYVLKGESIESDQKLNKTLAIDVPLCEPSLNTNRIALMLSPYRREYSANGQWPDRLPKVIQDVLFNTLSQRWGGQYVSRFGSGLQTSYVLQSEIQDFSVYKIDNAAPEIHLKIMFKVVDLRNRRIIDAHTFSEKRCVKTFTMQGIVKDFNQTLNALIGKSIPWMEKTFSKESTLNP